MCTSQLFPPRGKTARASSARDQGALADDADAALTEQSVLPRLGDMRSWQVPSDKQVGRIRPEVLQLEWPS